MQCREGCGACCIAPSIRAALPGMPYGKPAGVCCAHLDQHFRCRLFGSSQRPDVCARFEADPQVCGQNREQALELITVLELATEPEP